MGFSSTSNSSRIDACRDVHLGELGGGVPSALRRSSVSAGVRLLYERFKLIIDLAMVMPSQKLPSQGVGSLPLEVMQRH